MADPGIVERQTDPAHRWSRRVRTFVWLAAFLSAFTASHWPPPPDRPPPPIHDKTLHFTGFFALGVLTLWRRDASRVRISWIAASVCYVALLSYGALDELTQPFTGRSCELLDWVADAAGGATGILIVWVWSNWRKS